MSYEITYRRKLIKTANPSYGLFIEETGSNNCRSFNANTNREVRERSTYATLIDFKDNVKLKMWEASAERLQKEHPDKDILNWDPTFWLSWKSKATTVQGTINLFKEKAYKSFNEEQDDFDLFMNELPSHDWFLRPELINKEDRHFKSISEYIFTAFKKKARVFVDINPEDRIYNIQINWNNLVKFTRNWYRHSYSKNYSFTEAQMKRLKKKCEAKWYESLVIEKKVLEEPSL